MKHYTYLGRLNNIPSYKTWSEFKVGPNTISSSYAELQAAKISGRSKVANQLTEKCGYPEPEVVGSDPRDFHKWEITDSTVTEKIADILGFTRPSGRVQLLEPGAMVPLHIDPIPSGYIESEDVATQYINWTDSEKEKLYANLNAISRVLIFLEDWRHGQGVIFDDEWYDHWKAGDVVTWDWRTGMHATVNCGYWERPLLRLTGLVTDKFSQIVSAETPFDLNY